MRDRLAIALFLLSFNVYAQSGITWTAGMNIVANTYDNLHPRITTDASGNPLVIWGRISDESVFFSRWNGTAFTSPIKLNPAWLSVTAQYWMGPDIVSRGDTVYIVMKRTPEIYDTNRVFLVRSFDGGMTFSSPTELGFIADSISRFPVVTMNASGNPVVAFMKFEPGGMGDPRWVVTSSTDYGNTFGTDVKSSGWSGPGSVVCDCCPGSIISSGSKIINMYRDNLSNMRVMWAGVSDDDGVTFNTGFRIDDTNWQIFACPSSGPDGIVVGDTLYNVFMSTATGMSKVYLNKSSITNQTENTSALTGTITGLGGQNLPRIASDGNAAVVVWTQIVNGVQQLPLLFTNNIANGFPAAYDTVDLSNITNCDVAISNGNIYVVWQDDNSNTVKFRKGTFNPVGIPDHQTGENNFTVFPNPADDSFKIECLNHNAHSYEINDSKGTVLLYRKFSEPVTVFSINLKDYSSGIYFIKLFTEGGSIVKKVVKE